MAGAHDHLVFLPAVVLLIALTPIARPAALAAAVTVAVAGFLVPRAKLARHLDASAALRAGTSATAALASLMMLTSYSAFCELREEGLDEAAITAALQEGATQLLQPLSPGRRSAAHG